jgi:hypothetical protein
MSEEGEDLMLAQLRATEGRLRAGSVKAVYRPFTAVYSL